MVDHVFAARPGLVPVIVVDEDVRILAAYVVVRERPHHVESPDVRAVLLCNIGHERDAIADLPVVLLRQLHIDQHPGPRRAERPLVGRGDRIGESRLPAAVGSDGDHGHLLIRILISAPGKIDRDRRGHSRHGSDRLPACRPAMVR